MIKRRSVGLAIFLTLITCGIYGIFWFVFMTNEAGKLSGDPTFTGGKHFLLTLVTCGIWHYIWSYQIGGQIAKAQVNKGITAKDNGVLYLILNFFGLAIVTYALVQSDLNQMADA